MKGYIYSITFHNGKMYIGQTTKDPIIRKMQHVQSAYGSGKRNNACPKLYSAIRKYGVDFILKVLEEHERENVYDLCSVLDSREIELITKYDTIKSGYNCLMGGRGFRGFTV